MLPSGYIPVDSLGGTNCYFDTGVYTSDKTNIKGIFRANKEYPSYLFGARNSNSNTSAGQLDLLISGTSYIGFASARVSLGTTLTSGMLYIYNEGNQFYYNGANIDILERTGSTATFTGTRTMYILAMNNAGSVSYGSDPSCRVFYFSIEQNGTLVREYYPVYDTVTSQFGLYDFVNDNFITNQGTGSFSGHHLLTVQSSSGGNAYINLPYGKFTSQYCVQGIYGRVYSPLIAEAENGYSFLNWTDSNGNIVSIEKEFSPSINQDETYTANFIKIAKEQYNPFKLLGLQYGVGAISSASDPNGRDSDLYTLVESFSINEDGLTRTNSTIECRTIPSAYQVDMPVVLFDNKSHPIWIGLIKSINGNTLECREMLSITDQDFVFTPTTNVGGVDLSSKALLYAVFAYTNDFDTYSTSNASAISSASYMNNAGRRKTETLLSGAISYGSTFAYQKDKNLFITLPATSETNVGNLEDYFIGIFNNFGCAVESDLVSRSSTTYPQKGEKHLIRVRVVNSSMYDEMTLGDNVECISNLSVMTEAQETTVLIIYNSTSATLRGIYGMKNDGTVGEMDGSITNYIGYNECKTKVLLSDDKISTLIAQNLNNSMYNHKITFDLDLNNSFYELDDFKIGRKVNFYYGDTMYRSIVTGKQYSSNDGKISSVKITLGNVRTSLTTKINLGKLK